MAAVVNRYDAVAMQLVRLGASLCARDIMDFSAIDMAPRNSPLRAEMQVGIDVNFIVFFVLSRFSFLTFCDISIYRFCYTFSIHSRTVVSG